MRTFPKHIASVILDSPFPPNAPWIDFIHPFDIAFKVLEKRVAQDSIYAKAFPTIKKDYLQITERLLAIFSGEYDPVCPPIFANITAKSLSNSTVIIVPSASHAAMHADDCTRRIGKEFFLNP